MWKVMIADDEPKIRKGLRQFVDWTSLDMEVIGEAEDGLEALELSEASRPDILLVDICMPLLNGLEFVEKLLSFLPDSIVIIVTGHDEFEYAQQALKLGVFDYLLKPVSKEQLIGVLHSAKERLMKRKYTDWAGEQVGKHLPYLKERFLNDWMDGQLTESDVKDQLGFLQLPLEASFDMLLIKVISINQIQEAPKAWDSQALLLDLQHIIQELLRDWGSCIVYRDSKDNLIGMVLASGADRPVDISKAIVSAVDTGMKVKVSVFHKAEIRNFMDTPFIYGQLVQESMQETSVSPIVMLSQKYIQDHYDEVNLTLNQVADEFKISPSYLSRLLRQEIGLSFIDYLTQIRINQAVRLLQNPTWKIYEVAEKVGYSGQHYFSTAFKKVVGVSPIDYRKGQNK
jgi:two-component system, response regulator YesN